MQSVSWEEYDGTPGEFSPGRSDGVGARPLTSPKLLCACVRCPSGSPRRDRYTRDIGSRRLSSHHPRFLVLCALVVACLGTGAAAQTPTSAPDSLGAIAPDWGRPLESIGSVRRSVDEMGLSDRLGEPVLVTGYVTAGSGDLRADVHEIYIQDGTGGVRLPLSPTAPQIFRGDSVLVHGRVGFKNGMVEIDAPTVRRVTGETAEVVPIRLRLTPHARGGKGPDLEGHEGEWVEVEGRVVQIDSTGSGRVLVLMSGTDLVQVFAYRLRAAPVTFEGVRLGDYVRVRGIAVQHDLAPPYTGSYVVLPLHEADVRRAGLSPAEYRNGALVVAALLLGALLWAWALRVQVQRRSEALHLSETRYGTLLDAAADPVLVFDCESQGEIIEANRAAQKALGLGADGASPRGDRLRLGDVSPDPEAVQIHLSEAHRTGAASSVLALRRIDGSAAPYEFASRRLQAGDKVAVVSVARDISERQRYEHGLLEAIESAEAAREEAEEAARLKASILANMSHEFRTPLTAILGFSDVLADEVTPDLTEFAEAIRTGGRRLLDTLNDILEFARLDAEDVSFTVEAVDAVQMVRAAGARLAPLARQKGLRMALQASAPTMPVAVAPLALGRIVTLVAGNAIKFTERGEVRVSLHASDGTLVVRVQDTGVGIDEAFLPSLFEAFTQESDGHGRAFEGTGLGLAITKRLVDGMGGTIRVQSQRGVGTLFVITLPAPPASVSDPLPMATPRVAVLA